MRISRRVGALGALGALALIGAAVPRSACTDHMAAAAVIPASRDSLAAPAVGAEAPDFDAPSVSARGAAAPASVRALRGQVVVVAFYPKDRSSGCTAELSKFRDDFATLFGDGVTVLPISLDDMATHTSWAREMRFPFALVSDSAGAIAARYGSIVPGRPYASRTVFVIGKDGRVAWRSLRFGALDQNAYDALAAAVAAAKKG